MKLIRELSLFLTQKHRTVFIWLSDLPKNLVFSDLGVKRLSFLISVSSIVRFGEPSLETLRVSELVLYK